jgi:hypothetical protein
MTNLKISAATELVSLLGTELVPAVTAAGLARKFKVQTLIDAAVAASVGGSGGSGTLPDRLNGGVLITDWNAWLFDGMAYSAAGATGAPTTTPGYVGMYVGSTQNGVQFAWKIASATSTTASVGYLRERAAGAWGSWLGMMLSTDELDARYALKGSAGSNSVGVSTVLPLTVTGTPVTGVDSIIEFILGGAVGNASGYVFELTIGGLGTTVGDWIIEGTRNNGSSWVALSGPSAGGPTYGDYRMVNLLIGFMPSRLTLFRNLSVDGSFGAYPYTIPSTPWVSGDKIRIRAVSGLLKWTTCTLVQK